MPSTSSLIAFATGVRGELRKAVSPTVGIVFFIALGVVGSSIAFAASFADTQSDVQPNIANMWSQVDMACLDDTADDSDVCVAARLQATATQDFATQTERLGQIGNALSTAPGVVRFVSHHWATTIGWIVVGLIAAFHVAGEWTAGSIGVTAQSTGSRTRLIALKVFSTWLIALGSLAFTALVLVAARPLFVTDGLISNATQDGTIALGTDAAWTSWATAAADFALTAAVLFAVAIIAVGIALLLRRPVPTAFTVIAGLITMFLAGPSRWSPSQAIAGWLNFNDVNNGLIGDHVLWAYPGVNDTVTDPLVSIDLAPGIALWFSVAVALIAVGSAAVMNTRRSL